MDPLACWNSLCEAVENGFVEDARDYTENLITWLQRDGFRPHGVPETNDLIGFLSVLHAIHYRK